MINFEWDKTFWLALGPIFRVFGVIWHQLLVLFVGSKRNTLPPIRDHLLLESASSLADKIRTKKLTSKEVILAHVKRLESVNPLLNAVNEDRYEDALREAEAVDAFIQTTKKTPAELAKEKPLLGVPFTSKNSVAIKGMIMDSGVAAKKGKRAAEDSVVVANMRKAGAIPLCITNVPEYCMWFDASNTIYGSTNNPYDLTRIPGGSSGGEGAIIGSAASPIGMGTDIYGSIRMPAYHSGIFGHKPSRRVVSNVGHFHGTGYDEYLVSGPICKRAEDLLPTLKIMSENNPVLQLDKNVDVKKIQVYYTDDYPSGKFVTPLNPELKESIKKVVSYLEQVTGKKAKKISVPGLQRNIMTIKYSKYAHFKPPGMFESTTGKAVEHFNTTVELIKWVFRVSQHTLNAIIYLSNLKYFSTLTKEQIDEMDEKLKNLDEELKGILGDNGVLIYPNLPALAPYHQEQFMKLNDVCYTVPFNLLGYPVTQCPTGLSNEGLPMGLQVVGFRNNDRLTIAIGNEIENGIGGWTSPSPII